MIQQLGIYISPGVNPYVNIATEKLLLDTVTPDMCILYLWQNQNTVVIGRNQNPWAECRMSLLEQEGGKLARRLSGGGAVYHDLGNLNFTFIMSEENYDLNRQLAVIQHACATAGIETEVSGRNDILANGYKFSGNAFYHSKGKAYHHGTLLIDVDTEKLSRYLSPPKAKLQAKGIASVRSRVINLSQLAPGLTCDAMKVHMINAFSRVYGMEAQAITLTPAQEAHIQTLRGEYADREWLCATPPPFSISCEEHFSWGHIHLQLQVAEDRITQAKVYTDAMDWELASTLEQALTGCSLSLHCICDAITQCNALGADIRMDLQQMLLQQL